MARISTYPNDTNIAISDKLLGTDEFDLSTRNFAIGDILAFFMSGTSGYLPVFNDAGTLQNSVIFQDDCDSPTLLTFSINSAASGNFTVAGDFAVGGTSNFAGAVSTNGALNINSGVYFNGEVYDYNGNQGNSEQVLVSDQNGYLHWENYQGSGLEYQSAWDANTNVPDLAAITVDPSITGKYWVVSVAGNTPLSGYQNVPITDWQPGDWAIISEDSAGNVFWDKIDNTSVLTGSGNAATLAIWTNTRVLGDSAITWDSNNSKFITSQGFELNNIILNGAFYDSNDDSGDVSQVLSSTGSEETEWIDLPSPAVETAFIDIGKIPTWVGSSADKKLGAMLNPLAITPGDGGIYGGFVPEMQTTGSNPNYPNAPFIRAAAINLYNGALTNVSNLTFNQQGKLEVSSPGYNGGQIVVNPNGISVNSSDKLGVGGESKFNGRINVIGGGICISPFPSGVILDNTSMVIGSGDNDIVSGSDHSLAVGKGNQLTKSATGIGSDHSAAIGQANLLTDAKNSLAVGKSNVINASGLSGEADGIRSQVLGLNNTLTNTFASFVAGGQNTVGDGNKTGQNTFVLGYSNDVIGSGDNIYVLGNQIEIDAEDSETNIYTFGSKLSINTGDFPRAGGDNINDVMIIGINNNGFPNYTPNGNLGLGEPAVIVGSGNANSTNDGLIISKDTGNAASGVRGSRVIMPDLVSFDFANDTAAAAAGIPVGALYHTAGVVKVRLT